jgi:outer membrane protein OmpA-like peptidoglycan-associated protein
VAGVFARARPSHATPDKTPTQRPAPAGATAPPIVGDVLRSPGRPLDARTADRMGARFGFDFARVRIHDDGRAAASARAVGAVAYTVGSDVVFGAGRYDPASARGRRLLTHELTHVVQQSTAGDGARPGPAPATGLPVSDPADATEREAATVATQAGTRLPVVERAPAGTPVLHREITEDSIGTENGDFYSTNCGWVDTGHANPKLARELIAFVREASQRIERRETALTETLTAEAPALVTETECPPDYEAGERADSGSDAPVMTEVQHPSGAVDIVVGGFGVDSSDATKFGPIVRSIAQTHVAWETLRGQTFGVEVRGFSDCVGQEERNDALRLARSFAIASALSRTDTDLTVGLDTDGALTDFVASNATRAGRRANRGVLIRLVPQVTPERFGTPTMESRKFGVRFSAVTPEVEITRTLSEEEVLAVALTIFATQSFAFETTQSWRDEIPGAPPSSMFAEEDMPSNLIGFYRAARGFSIAEVRSLCGAWDEDASLEKLRGYEFAPNPTFRPQRLEPGGAWPSEFETITPAPFGSDVFTIVRLRQHIPITGVRSDCTVDAGTGSITCP